MGCVGGALLQAPFLNVSSTLVFGRLSAHPAVAQCLTFTQCRPKTSHRPVSELSALESVEARIPCERGRTSWPISGRMVSPSCMPPRSALCATATLIAVIASGCSVVGRLAKLGPVERKQVPAARPDIDADNDPALQASFIAQEPPIALADDEDYVVRVVVGAVTCSGTLIAEDEVLTAHHCVARRDRNSRPLSVDADPYDISVELGGDYMPWAEVGVRYVVAPNCGYTSGYGDLAILILERRMAGAVTLVPNLDREPELGQVVTPIGFGRCAMSNDGVKRRKRKGGPIDLIVPDRFQLQAAICPGDSGGPALSSDRQIVGVVSSSAMDGDSSTRERSEFTRLDAWRPLFANAERVAQGVSVAELPPVDCNH